MLWGVKLAAMDLTYTQANGYAVYTGKTSRDFPELARIVDYQDELRGMGYVRQWRYAGGDGQGDEAEGFELEDTNKYGFPRYLVVLWDENNGHHIYCENPGDFFALRMEMARNHQVANPLLLEMLEVARKAFRALHGHEHDTICKKCDPDGWREQQEAAIARSAKR